MTSWTGMDTKLLAAIAPATAHAELLATVTEEVDTLMLAIQMSVAPADAKRTLVVPEEMHPTIRSQEVSAKDVQLDALQALGLQTPLLNGLAEAGRELRAGKKLDSRELVKKAGLNQIYPNPVARLCAVLEGIAANDYLMDSSERKPGTVQGAFPTDVALRAAGIVGILKKGPLAELCEIPKTEAEFNQSKAWLNLRNALLEFNERLPSTLHSVRAETHSAGQQQQTFVR